MTNFYTIEKRNSAATANQMGELWELLINQSARVYRAKRVCTRKDILLLPHSWQGEDLFRAQGAGYTYATVRSMDWLEEHAGEYVTFQVARTKDVG